MRKILLFVLIALVGFVLLTLLVADRFWGQGSQGGGWLTVKTNVSGQSIIVDGEMFGQTPLDRVSIASGNHFLQITDGWQGTIAVASNKESQIVWNGFSGSGFGYGYIIGFEARLGGLGPQRDHVFVRSEPVGAEVWLGGEQKGSTPLLLEDLSGDSYKVALHKLGYADVSVDVASPRGGVARVEVSMRPALLDQREQLHLDVPVGSGANIVIHGRQEWGGGSPSLGNFNEDWQLIDWQQLALWGVHFGSTSTDLSDTLIGIDSYLRENNNLPGIPFAYLIDEQGVVWEGLGVYDLDYSKIDGMGYGAGDVPVLILDSDGAYENELVRQALSGLRAQLGVSPVSTARQLTALDTLTVPMGEIRTVSVKYQNTSPLVWQDSPRVGEMVLYALTEVGQASDFYLPARWRSISEVSGLPQARILPGETVDWEFQVQAPYYPGDFTTRFGLKDKATGQLVAQSEFTLRMKVEGEVGGILFIQKTPTGSLNVRSGPGLNYALLTTIYPGDKFAWLKNEGDWYQIIMRDGGKGWVSSEYVLRQ